MCSSDLLVLAWFSWVITPWGLRPATGFTWFPIAEVAKLFLGIFVTFALFARKVPAALLVSIVVMTVISIVTGVAPMPALESLTGPLVAQLRGDSSCFVSTFAAPFAKQAPERLLAKTIVR